jgi:hypothetical protein
VVAVVDMDAHKESANESESDSSDEIQAAGAAALDPQVQRVIAGGFRGILLDHDEEDASAAEQPQPPSFRQPVVQETHHVPDELNVDRFNVPLVAFNIIALAKVQLYEEQRQQRLIQGLLRGEASQASTWGGGPTPICFQPSAHSTRPHAANLSLWSPTATSSQCNPWYGHATARHNASQIFIRCTFGEFRNPIV